MVDAGLGSSTIENVRLSGVRKLVNEACENGLVDPSDAGRIVSVANVPDAGVRLGQWLTVEQTRDLLAVPDSKPDQRKARSCDPLHPDAVRSFVARRPRISTSAISNCGRAAGCWPISAASVAG